MRSIIQCNLHKIKNTCTQKDMQLIVHNSKIHVKTITVFIFGERRMGEKNGKKGE